jgi:hypothetical protein
LLRRDLRHSGDGRREGRKRTKRSVERARDGEPSVEGGALPGSFSGCEAREVTRDDGVVGKERI